MIWFSSDMHYFHKNIIRLCNRPFEDLDEMHRELQSRWNEKVSQSDIVYIVGDFSFGQASKTRKILNNLNGKKILIRGNHDKPKSIPEDCYAEIHDTLDFSLFEENDTILNHYPYRQTPEELEHAEQNGYTLKHLDKRPIDEGKYLIHGHIHDRWKVKRNMVNVSVEVWDYAPVSPEDIKKVLKEA